MACVSHGQKATSWALFRRRLLPSVPRARGVVPSSPDRLYGPFGGASPAGQDRHQGPPHGDIIGIDGAVWIPAIAAEVITEDLCVLELAMRWFSTAPGLTVCT